MLGGDEGGGGGATQAKAEFTSSASSGRRVRVLTKMRLIAFLVLTIPTTNAATKPVFRRSQFGLGVL